MEEEEDGKGKEEDGEKEGTREKREHDREGT